MGYYSDWKSEVSSEHSLLNLELEYPLNGLTPTSE